MLRTASLKTQHNQSFSIWWKTQCAKFREKCDFCGSFIAKRTIHLCRWRILIPGGGGSPVVAGDVTGNGQRTVVAFDNWTPSGHSTGEGRELWRLVRHHPARNISLVIFPFSKNDREPMETKKLHACVMWTSCCPLGEGGGPVTTIGTTMVGLQRHWSPSLGQTRDMPCKKCYHS